MSSAPRFGESLKRKSLWVSVLSEFIGTALLVFLAIGVIYIHFKPENQKPAPVDQPSTGAQNSSRPSANTTEPYWIGKNGEPKLPQIGDDNSKANKTEHHQVVLSAEQKQAEAARQDKSFGNFKLEKTPDELVPYSFKVIILAAGIGAVVGGIIFCLGFGFPHGSAHLNPAFTVGALVLDKVSVVRAVLFIVAQCLGGLAGGAILYGCFSSMRASHFACTTLASEVDALQGFGIEFLGTFTLVFGVLAIVGVSERHRYGAVAVAGAVATLVAIIVIIAAPYTGASLNPARSVGPALVFAGKCWASHWVYWAGPLTGGLLAGAVVRILLFNEDTTTTRQSGETVELHESRKLVVTTNA